MREPCYKCKFEHKPIDREPCEHCSDVYIKTGDHPAFQYAKPTTQYDRIISKTPEELAEWIETIANCDSCQYSWSLGKCRGGDGTSHATCRLKWLEWLQQEA